MSRDLFLQKRLRRESGLSVAAAFGAAPPGSWSIIAEQDSILFQMTNVLQTLSYGKAKDEVTALMSSGHALYP